MGECLGYCDRLGNYDQNCSMSTFFGLDFNLISNLKKTKKTTTTRRKKKAGIFLNKRGSQGSSCAAIGQKGSKLSLNSGSNALKSTANFKVQVSVFLILAGGWLFLQFILGVLSWEGF